MHIHIERLEDEHHCETCGWSIASGAKISIDNREVLTLTPHAHCLGGQDYSTEDVFKAILQHLGHTVEID